MSDDYVRVTDKDTGYRRSIRKHLLPHGNYTVLKQDAVDAAGEPLPPEFPDASTSEATTKEKS